jgi:hypothetical protein
VSAELKARAVVIAKSQLGVQERGGRNTGPEVDAYLLAVGLQPGQPWCCAFVLWCYLQAASELGEPMPLRRTGKVTRLWDSSACFGRQGPSVGDIYCHATDPADRESPGHCGIVVAVRPDGAFTAIEGNTNKAGSREGNSVWSHPRALAFANLGFVDISAESTARPRVA